ncbi:hypothetical protein EDB87DRAFT_1679471 [Lactarius vividus]|nr:hypothetical protein EDB87DRAFT_1679471 [Lactarius vividus]
MSSYRPDTASTFASSGYALTGSQAGIFQELKGATFSIDLTARGAPLQADSDNVQKVFDHLRGDTYMTLLSDEASTKNILRLPTRGFKEESKSSGPSHTLISSSTLPIFV